jgi:serine/threonine protein kinase
MSDYPDFSTYGYQISKILGQNSTGGRVTYLAFKDNNHQAVVIKQYQFIRTGPKERVIDSYETEIDILRSLYCQNIPRYLDSFDTATGFCLVQEYKNAPSLENSRSYTPAEIKIIALAILDIIIYLQKQTPSVIHGDIKPENILIDQDNPGLVYLVDFGFARGGSGEILQSNVMKGTLGFMPPEEMFNRILTKASDLYSLGVTLICLLTQTKSVNISQLIDEKTYQLQYKSHLPPLNLQFIQWLDRMIAPNVNNRYPNAETAKRALEPISMAGNQFFLPWKYQINSPNLFKILGCLGLAFLAGLAGFNCWKNQELTRLLNTKNCRDCSLVSANLNRADLKGANLARANLEKVDLRGADLQGANLQGANLEGALMDGANLTGANLSNSILKNSRLIAANLQTANLKYANLENAIFDDANLAQVNLQYTILINAKFRFTRLHDSNLQGANLAGTDLGGAILRGATLPNGQKNP